MKESTFSAQVREYVRGRGGVFFVNTASVYDRTGRPDCEIFYKGYAIVCELKTGKYQPTNEQIKVLQELRDNGIIALLVRDNVDEIALVMDLIDQGNVSEYEMPPLPPLKVRDLF